jgi:hypothetical protein
MPSPIKRHKPATLNANGTLRPQANRTGRDADPRRLLPLKSAVWQRLRIVVLADEPLCRACRRQGRVVPATDVDHDDGNPGNNDRDNLVALCHSCHSRKTAQDHGGKVSYGCSAQGRPLDPNHEWNREKSPATDLARPSASLHAHVRE